MKSKVTVKSNIPQMTKNLEELENNPLQVTLSESINSEFLAGCSNFTSLEDMFSKSGFKIETQEDFAAIPDDEWDNFIAANTTYENWHDLQVAAIEGVVSRHVHKQLTKGFKKL
ncbi:hypothetical protein ABRZ24_05925 [Brenneria populi]|uniref:Uncharacterized protein n=1 Tax=Brenneria populi TaxID=1505588 RepID=A0ABU6JN55_9GAMM|nr:hypothetical protein [Brenneria populi Li et al. 2015]